MSILSNKLQIIELTVDMGTQKFISPSLMSGGRVPDRVLHANSDIVLNFTVYENGVLKDLSGGVGDYQLAVDNDFDHTDKPFVYLPSIVVSGLEVGTYVIGSDAYVDAQAYVTTDETQGECAFLIHTRDDGAQSFLTKLGDTVSANAYLALWRDAELLVHDSVILKNVPSLGEVSRAFDSSSSSSSEEYSSSSSEDYSSSSSSSSEDYSSSSSSEDYSSSSSSSGI